MLENLELTKRDLKLLDEIERDLNKVHGDEEADETRNLDGNLGNQFYVFETIRLLRSFS